MKEHKKYYPHLKVVFAFTIWSSLGLFLNKSTFTPIQNLFNNALIALTLTLSISYFKNKLRDFKKVNLSDPFLWLLFFTQGLGGIVWFKALTLMDIGPAVLIHDLGPVLTAVLAPIIIKEPNPKKIYLALPLGFLGLFLVLGAKGFNLQTFLSLGAVLAFLSAIAFALIGVANRKLTKRYSLSFIIFWAMVAQVLLTSPLAFSQPWRVTHYSILISLFLGVFSSTLAMYLFVGGFKSLPAVTVNFLGYIEPVLATLWGALFLSQSITLLTVLGGTLILYAGYLVVRGGN